MAYFRVVSLAFIGFVINLIALFAPQSMRVPQPPLTTIQEVPDLQNSSANWAGYAAEGGNFSGVSGTWTIPQNSGSNRFGADATWVGIGGVDSKDLIQAGTQQTIARNTTTSYSAWFETLPENSHPLPIQVNGGDSVTVSVKEESLDSWIISFKDNTTGQSVQENIPYQSSHSSAEWIEEAPSTRWTVLPLDNFGSVSFSNASAVKEGQIITLSESGASPITLTVGNGAILAVPSSIGGDGTSFSVKRTQTPATTTSQSPTIIRFGRTSFINHGFGRRAFHLR